LIKIVVWVATGFFVGMLFSPLVSEMVVRLSTPSASGLP
jgi:hypothetical protein